MGSVPNMSHCGERRVHLGNLLNSAGRLAALPVYAALAISPACDARAQTPPGSAVTAVLSFAIPAQPLANAIDAFIRVTGWQVGYSSANTARLQSPGVSGTMAPAEALRRLLAGSGLAVRMSGQTTATLVAASAQATPAEAASDTVVLEPITVSGEKVERDYQRVYTSVGVVTGETIQDQAIPDVKKSFELLANVRANSANRGNNGFTIRGISSEGFQPTNYTPIISVIVDGAIQNGEATRRGARGVWDVDQIEVLRGPQSSLQGRNALGGAVLIKSKDPTFTPEAIVEAQGGTDDYRSAGFVVSGPVVSDEFAARLSGQMLRETKDITYVDSAAATLGKDELDQIRGKFLWTPKSLPGFSALVTISHTRDKPGVTAVTGPDFFARRFDAALSSVEFRETAVNNYITDLAYEIAPGWKLKSVTAFADTAAKIDTPAGSGFDRKELRDGGDFSHDTRLVFDPPGSPLSGVIGVFAGRFISKTDSLIDVANPFGFPPMVTFQDLVATNTTTSIAAYADLRYRFLDRWTLILGGRILRDEVENDFNGFIINLNTFMPESLTYTASVTETVFLPKVGLAYDIASNQTLAATVNRGYRNGFAEVVAGFSTINQVKPEYLWSYELAYRSRWFDDRLQLNGNLFYYDYRNQQIGVDNPLVPPLTFTQNAEKSHAYGAEIDARARVTNELTLFSSVGLLKTEFDDAVTLLGTFNGNRFPEAPTVTAALGGIWKHHTGWFASGNVSHTSGYYSSNDPLNDPRRFVGDYTLVNAQFGYENRHGTVALFARNLLDEKYLTSISAGYNEATIGDGRMIGIRATGRL